jgi:hypothetical protein
MEFIIIILFTFGIMLLLLLLSLLLFSSEYANSRKNKLFLITQTVINNTGACYQMIVSAKNEDEARLTHPSGTVTHNKNNVWMCTLNNNEYEYPGSDVWINPEEVKLLDVKYIGNTDEKSGIIMKTYIEA